MYISILENLWNNHVLGATKPIFLKVIHNIIVKPDLAVAAKPIAVLCPLEKRHHSSAPSSPP
jgi:hypothetical protein